jgi:hypothetical protein
MKIQYLFDLFKSSIIRHPNIKSAYRLHGSPMHGLQSVTAFPAAQRSSLHKSSIFMHFFLKIFIIYYLQAFSQAPPAASPLLRVPARGIRPPPPARVTAPSMSPTLSA